MAQIEGKNLLPPEEEKHYCPRCFRRCADPRHCPVCPYPAAFHLCEFGLHMTNECPTYCRLPIFLPACVYCQISGHHQEDRCPLYNLWRLFVMPRLESRRHPSWRKIVKFAIPADWPHLDGQTKGTKFRCCSCGRGTFIPMSANENEMRAQNGSICMSCASWPTPICKKKGHEDHLSDDCPDNWLKEGLHCRFCGKHTHTSEQHRCVYCSTENDHCYLDCPLVLSFTMFYWGHPVFQKWRLFFVFFQKTDWNFGTIL